MTDTQPLSLGVTYRNIFTGYKCIIIKQQRGFVRVRFDDGSTGDYRETDFQEWFVPESAENAQKENNGIR